jgi:hypothetical protein
MFPMTLVREEGRTSKAMHNGRLVNSDQRDVDTDLHCHSPQVRADGAREGVAEQAYFRKWRGTEQHTLKGTTPINTTGRK